MENEKYQELVLEQLKALAEGQRELRQDVKGLQQDVKTLQQGQHSLEARMDNLESGQKSLETSMDSLEAGQRRIETRIENEVIEKVRALFDDRSMNQDYFISIRDAVARVENRVEFLARQNIEHLEKMREHDRELRLLRAEKK